MDNLILNRAYDMDLRCFNKNIVTSSKFLDLNEQSEVLRISKDFRSEYILWGGYENAERKILVFLPGRNECEYENLLSALEVKYKGEKQLTHRDFLGAAVGLGIKRENIGDIIVSENSAQIIVISAMKNLFLSEYTKAGRQNLEICEIPADKIRSDEGEFICFDKTVQSLRADCVVAAVFNISRSKAQKLFEMKRVFINDALCLKPDCIINSDSCVKVSKMGKAEFEIGGMSRKDRIFLTVKRYR